jgi:16S rRNA (cytosine1402-N4)-methyltransferase
MNFSESGHDSVLLDEVLDYLAPAGEKIIVDCTLGRGGHAFHIAQRLTGGCLIGIDADLKNLEFSQNRLSGLPCRFFNGNFAQIGEILSQARVGKVDGILADLGVSTNQLLNKEYGMSFASDGPLDMRLDPHGGPSAADVVNFTEEGALADILYNLAQERFSRKIARRIVEVRRNSPILTTFRLADLVRGVVHAGKDRIDPATRTFLALRMHVNREMENLDKLLGEGFRQLKPGGRMVVISFQSMEDGKVKWAFRKLAEEGKGKILTKKPVEPSEEELRRNPRSRSSKLRVIEAL